MSKTESQRGIHYYPAVGRGEPAPALRGATGEPLAVYVHIPFCDKRCYFCEFAVVAGKRVTDSLVGEYLGALRNEIAGFRRGAGRTAIELIQIGGGTPTSLSAAALEELLGFLFAQFDCSALKEIIVEGFPTSITDDRIAVLERVPNLKLNIGVQSFHVECLESVGREHGAQAEVAIERAVASSIESVGVDIIFGLPFSTPATVRSDLEKACDLGVEHFALYPLWIYEQTALESRVRAGQLALPDRGRQREQLFAGTEVLSSRGYSRYTAFHHALAPAARHRYGLWQMLARDWVGFGMSAMSHIGGTVSFNDKDIRSYIDKVQAGVSLSTTSHRLSAIEQMKFAVLYGLRLETYSRSLFLGQFNVHIEEVFGAKLHALEQRGLLRCAGDGIALTLEGILAMGEIEDCFNDASEPLQGTLAR